MEETRRKRPTKQPPVTRAQVIIQSWERLDRPAVGARELREIQTAVDENYSPAAIARVLADEGAELLHPQVIECDALWREERMRGAVQPEAEAFVTLAQTESLIEQLEEQRIQSGADAQSLRSVAIAARQLAERNSRRKSLSQRQRAEQHEIAEWLGVWIKTPGLFRDWLELRRRSPDFRKKFAE